MSTPTLDDLQDIVGGQAVAFRSRVRMQPAGGAGTKVFPPTYAGAEYASEKRRLPDREDPVECVLLDSVQSQANRMEEALQMAIDEGRLALPLIEVDFGPYFPGDDKDESLRLLDPIGKVSSLQAPHRISDAILRDSEINGTKFRESELGRDLDRVSLRNATPLFELCPTALLFGTWDSTGHKGGLGAKFERAIVSEIVGIDAVRGVKTSGRIDPLGIQKEAGPLYLAEDGCWTLDEKQAKRKNGKAQKAGKDGRPSEVNHGNIAPSLTEQAGGVTISHAEQTVVISLPALRRLRFPPKGESWQASSEQHERDKFARVVLAMLGLCAATLADESGLDLRSRCLLYPEEARTWEVLEQGGKRSYSLSGDEAIKLFQQAVDRARDQGLPWRTQPLVLSPSEKLVELVVKSQRLAASQGVSEDE